MHGRGNSAVHGGGNSTLGEGGGVGGVEAGDEAVDLVAGPGDLGELSAQLLHLGPEVRTLLYGDAALEQQAPQVVAASPGPPGLGHRPGRNRSVPVDPSALSSSATSAAHVKDPTRVPPVGRAPRSAAPSRVPDHLGRPAWTIRLAYE